MTIGDREDEEFLALLDGYLDVPHDPNPTMANVRIVWVEHDPGVGALHIAGHNVTKEEVEQVLFEIPPDRGGETVAAIPRPHAVLGRDSPGSLDLRGL